jgi:hypothetical protein
MLYRYFRDAQHATTFNKGTLRFYEINKYIATTNDSIADKNESALINVLMTLSVDNSIAPITCPTTIRTRKGI